MTARSIVVFPDHLTSDPPIREVLGIRNIINANQVTIVSSMMNNSLLAQANISGRRDVKLFVEVDVVNMARVVLGILKSTDINSAVGMCSTMDRGSWIERESHVPEDSAFWNPFQPLWCVKDVPWLFLMATCNYIS